MTAKIAVPYFPGSNGASDVIARVKEFGMEPIPLYFNIGNPDKMAENARIIKEEVDGAVLPGGFPYQDRLGFGVVPSKIKPFAEAIRYLVDSGKPVLAFCSGNQIAHAFGLAFPEGSDYKVQMLRNICDQDGELVNSGFMDDEIYTRLSCSPERTAFTRTYQEDDAIKNVMDHGGGRFFADENTLQYILEHGMIVTRYSNSLGLVEDNFPINPNGSMLNIEGITNPRGNLLIRMLHDERKLVAGKVNSANLVFESMRKYIEDGCPDLSSNGVAQDIPLEFKDYSYLSPVLNPLRTLDISIKMLTDDNELMTARAFLGADFPIQRRRLLRLELSDIAYTEGGAKEILMELAKMDFLEGVMLKKDQPTIVGPGIPILGYEVTDKTDGVVTRDFVERSELVPGHPVSFEQVDLPNVEGYLAKEQMWRNTFLENAVKEVVAGSTFHFPDEKSKQQALEGLLG